jgi:glycerol-3-phosphate O-acyltransferase
MSDRPLASYEPNPALAWLYRRFFDHIVVDESWASAVREADRRGTVVYVLRSLSFVDFLALDHLTKRLHLPQVRFANDLGLWILEPMGRGWFQKLKPRTEDADARDLKRAVTEGSSAALFLKKPPTLLEPAARGRIEGDVFIRALFEAQRTAAIPILLVPQVFIWSKRPDAAKHNALDAVLGPREWPGKIRTVAQFLANYRNVTLRAGEPVSVKSFLDQELKTDPDEVLVRRMTYLLLRRLERERRTVLGPARKPPERMREEVVRSPKLQKVIHDMAGEGAHERRVLNERALEMVREMESALDMSTIPAMDATLTTLLTRMYAGVEVDEAGFERLREVAKDGSLVLLPSHKSHVDYMVMAWVFYHRHMPIPITAAGDNLNFFPMGPIFRRAGAFFIRRSFGGDRLYGAVVDAYVRRLIKDNWVLEFFLEGGRSRTGKLLAPKLGLLSIVVDAVLGAPGRKVYFCPISIGYERLVEEKAFVHEVSGGEKEKEDVRGMLKGAGVLRGRYGRISVQFGVPLSLEDMNADGEDLARLTPAKRRAIVTRLAYRVMNEINRVTAVTPGALVATAFLTHGRRGIAHPELVALCQRLTETLQGFGARFAPSLVGSRVGLRVEAVREACELFARAGHVEVHEAGVPLGSASKARAGPTAIYVVPDSARLSLDLAKNIVVHFFVSRALVATALLTSPGASAEPRSLSERVQSLSRLFKHEFQFRADATFEQIFEEILSAMTRAGELSMGRARVTVDPRGQEQVRLYASIVKNFVEGYRIAARALTALVRGPATPKDFVKRAIAVGERMFLAGEIERREAVCGPVIENAALAFIDQGYLRRDSGKLALCESYASAEAARTIEAKIASYVTRRDVV